MDLSCIPAKAGFNTPKNTKRMLSHLKKHLIPIVGFPYGAIFNRHERRLLRSELSPLGTNDAHLHATMDWLMRAYTQNGQGLAMSFRLGRGWSGPYPETTGYAIPTFLSYARRYGRSEFHDAAVAMGRWLVTVMDSSGGVSSPATGPLAFDTAQVLQGLSSLSAGDRDSALFLSAAQRSLEWLSTHQEKEGYWERHDYNCIRHSYSARISSCMLQHTRRYPNEAAESAARRNLDFVMAQIRENGWIESANFDQTDRPPVLHSIGYIAEGLLDSYVVTLDGRYLSAAQKIADAVLLRLRDDGFIAGAFDRNWMGENEFACLTGCAQMAVVWFHLERITGNLNYKIAAQRCVDYIKSTQRISSGYAPINGAVAGSYPIGGRYAPYSYPNWAAKYFADALMLASLKE